MGLPANYDTAKSLLSSGPSRPTLYELQIPNLLDNRTTDYIKMFCKEVSIPGMGQDVATAAGTVNMGVTRKVPYGVTWGQNAPLIATIIENSDWTAYSSLRRMFDVATSPVGASVSSGLAQGAPSNPQQQSQSVRMNYYDNIVFNMTLTKLEFPDNGFAQAFGNGISRNIAKMGFAIEDLGLQSGYKRVCEFTFNNCYVTSLAQITLSSEAQNTALDIKAGFSYETYGFTRIGNLDQAYW